MTFGPVGAADGSPLWGHGDDRGGAGVNLRIWGSRGSLPAPGPQTARYGGDTSCVEARLSDDSVVVLDAGSGIRRLGESLMAEGVGVVHVLLTHLHLDHI